MSESESDSILLPGDYIATCEEFIPGEGTYEEEGIIYSAVMGKLKLNRNEMLAEIVPVVSSPVRINTDDIIIGRVSRIVKGYVFVDICYKKGDDREVTGENQARAHISNISTEYIKDTSQAFSVNDIIRAEVTRSEPNIEITTAREDLGVIRSTCHGCGSTFQCKNGKLVCVNCDIVLKRKLSSDYGQWKI